MKKEPSKGWLEFRQNAPQKIKEQLSPAGGWLKNSFAMEGRQALALFKAGLVLRQPALVLLLGVCAALPLTTTLQSSVLLALVITAALVLGHLVLSLLRHKIPQKCPLTTAHPPGYGMVNGLSLGLGLGLALVLLGALRELLGAGALWGTPLLGEHIPPILLLAAPCGGLLLLGCIMAFAKYPKCINRLEKLPQALVAAGLVLMALMGFTG